MPGAPANEGRMGKSSKKCEDEQPRQSTQQNNQTRQVQKSVSEARKLQNRISSKRYREKRKQKLETLQNLEQLLAPLIENDQSSGSSNVSANHASGSVPGDFLPGTSECSADVPPPLTTDLMNGWEFGDIFSTPQFTEPPEPYSLNGFLLQTSSQLSSNFVPELGLQIPEQSFPNGHSDTWSCGPDILNTETTSKMPDSNSLDLATEQYDYLANISDRKNPEQPISAAKLVTYLSKLSTYEINRAGSISLETGVPFLDLLCGGLEACLGRRALTAEESNEASMTEIRKLQGNAFLTCGLPTYLSNKNHPNRYLTPRVPYVANIRMNNIHINQVLLLAAVYENARALGYNFGDYSDENLISPICVSEGEGDDQVQTVIRKYASLAKDLRPTVKQIRQPHHLYLDLIPFPEFRQHAITAACADPPLLNEDEFCIDLLDDGLICHGNAKGGTGTPWDMRSWEPRTWFLEKYWFLVGDMDGDMWSSAKWWQAMRGDGE